jgi:hypothetical protein
VVSACGSTKAPTDGAVDGRHDAGGADAAQDTTQDTTRDAGSAEVDALGDGPAVDTASIEAASPDVPEWDVPAEVPVPDAEEPLPDAPLADLAPEVGDDEDGGTDDAADAGCTVGTIAGSHLLFEFDARNAEWVRSLQWRDSTGTLTDNLARYGGGPGCSSPYEFFGQAYAAPENNGPYPVGTSTLASLTGCGVDQTITSQTPDCTNAGQIPVTTVYHFYRGAKADQVRITRTLAFDESTGTSSGVGMRFYVPRLSVEEFPDVLIPNAAGAAVATRSAKDCSDDCLTPTGADWNGKWFADVSPSSGRAMIVVRDPSLTTAVSLTLNNDGYSVSNLSSFVVLQPSGGWSAPVTEIEYFCFADLTTWPQTARDAATLPAFCGP